MGFFQWIASAFRPKWGDPDWGHFIAPSEPFPNAVDAIAQLIPKAARWQWLTFEATTPNGVEAVEVHKDEINTCNEQVDVPDIARKIGLDALAETIRASGKDPGDKTIHRLSNATPQELAEIVNAIFIHHFGLPADYQLEGYLED